MGFANLTAYADSLLEGRSTYFTWRKTPSQATTTAVWFDLSMSPGNPVPQYYAASPLRATALSQSADGGLYHGGPISPRVKHLAQFTALSASGTGLPMPMRLLDYLLFYPFIDEGTTDDQFMDNTVTLPRWTDGEGVQMMAVSVAGRTGGQDFQVTYTNQDGVPGRLSKPTRQNTATAIGSIVSSPISGGYGFGPFVPLQDGDTGVRSVESVRMLGADVGLFALVLVKPLAQASLREQTAPVEVNYLMDFSQLPVIADDAYLGIIGCPLGSLSGVALYGDITTVWSA